MTLWPTVLVSAGALAYGLVFFVVPRRTSASWIPWVVSAIDVSLASTVLGVLILLGYPLAAMNSRVMFDWYFVAVTLATLRFDWRPARSPPWSRSRSSAGLLRPTCATHWDLRTAASPTHGSFVPVQFVGRLLMLAGHGAAGRGRGEVGPPSASDGGGRTSSPGCSSGGPSSSASKRSWRRADVTRTQLSVAIFDVDEFKRVQRPLQAPRG